MKAAVYSQHSPHGNMVDKKPLHDNEEQSLYRHGSQTPRASLYSYVTPQGYHMPSDSGTNWVGQPYMHSQQPMQLASPFYGQGTMYWNQMHYFYPDYNCHTTAGPPMLPSMGPYFGYPHPSPQGPPPPRMPHTQSLDSRCSLSSSHSSDNFGGSSAKRRHGRRNRRGSRHGGGSSPNQNQRGCRYDTCTTCFQMKGRIVEIAKDRDGSKFIQRRLRVADLTEMQLVFDEAVDGIEEVWDDVYGNYILEGLLELGTDDMRALIGKKILSGDTVSLSKKAYGCRLVQNALDTLGREGVANMVSSTKGKVCLLVRDYNGNHVIQKSVTKINDFIQESQDDPVTALLLKSLDVIIEEVVDNMEDLAVHPYGCRVVQRLIEHCNGSQKTAVIDSILLGGLVGNLINHEYGNYVVQRLLAFGRPAEKAVVFEAITSNGNILKHSKQKYSSNVIEMLLLLSYSDAAQRHGIVEEMLNCFCVDENNAQKSAVVSMAEDNYANYVLKTALDVLEEGPQKERLFGILLLSVEELEKSQYAKQIVMRVKAYAQKAQET